MANKKFSDFTLKTDTANVDFLVGYDGSDNVRIAPSNVGGGATSLNGLTDCLVDTDSLYVGEVPAGLSGNPQSNTILGIDAGNALTTGENSTYIGNDAGLNATVQGSNTAIGKLALRDGGDTTSSENTAVGYRAGERSTGSSNVFLGLEAGLLSTGDYSTFLGYKANQFNSPSGVVAVGYFAGNAASGLESIYIGREASISNTASGHISVGYRAGYSQTSGSNNINIGYEAGYDNTTQSDRTMVGYEAGEHSTGAACTFIGLGAGKGSSGNSFGAYNTAIGKEAGLAITSGTQNVLAGASAGDSITTGTNNIVIGYEADASSATVSNEITLGDANITALRIPGLQSGASDGDVLTYASGTGLITLQAAGGGGASNLNGLSDCLIDGTSSYLVEVPSGLSGNPVDNTVIGNDAGAGLTTGFGNTYIGFEAGKSITDSDNMVLIGRQAGNDSASGGDRTVAIGYDAHGSSMSTDCVAVG